MCVPTTVLETLFHINENETRNIFNSQTNHLMPNQRWGQWIHENHHSEKWFKTPKLHSYHTWYTVIFLGTKNMQHVNFGISSLVFWYLLPVENQNSGSRSTFSLVKSLTLNAELSNLKGSLCRINMCCSTTESPAFSSISVSFVSQLAITSRFWIYNYIWKIFWCCIIISFFIRLIFSDLIIVCKFKHYIWCCIIISATAYLLHPESPDIHLLFGTDKTASWTLFNSSHVKLW